MKRYYSLSAILVALFMVASLFNACSNPVQTSWTGESGPLKNTSTAGNPMTPVSNQMTKAVCTLLSMCHSVAPQACEKGLLSVEGIGAKLGLSTQANLPFSAFVDAEAAGRLAVRGEALRNCSVSISALSCGDPRVQEAYKASAANPFASTLALFSTETNSCPDVATEVLPSKYSWAALSSTAGLNFSPTQNSSDPQGVSWNNKIYMTWIENNSAYNVRVAVVTTDGQRKFIDGGTTGGLNVSATRMAAVPHLQVMSDRLYAIWVENNGFKDIVRAKVYNGNDAAPSWVSIDGGGLNKSLAENASGTELAVLTTASGSQLYATWAEENSGVQHIRVAAFNGDLAAPAWSLIDGGGTKGLNFDVLQSASNPRLIQHGSALIATWSETNAANGIKRIRVARYDGSSWSFIDGGTQNGIGIDRIQNAQNPHLAVFKSKLYLTWQEWNSPTAEQIRVSVYDGTKWTSVDGGGTTGLNWTVSGDAQVPQLLAVGPRLLVTWREQVSGRGTIRARQFNGNELSPSWTFIDGDTSSGLNRVSGSDAGFSSKRNPGIVAVDSKLGVFWNEGYRIQLSLGTGAP